MIFWACGDSSSNTVVVSNTEVESSSSQAIVVSSSEISKIESSSEVSKIESSSSLEAIEPSSSQNTVESSTKVLSKLPFDTTGIKPDVAFYTTSQDSLNEYIDLAEFTNKEEGLKNVVLVQDTSHYCREIGANDTIVSTLVGIYPELYAFIEKGDSLLITDNYGCTEAEWETCSSGDYFSISYEKIIVNSDTFYYAETTRYLKLLKITDNTIYKWTEINPKYTPPVVNVPKTCFTESLREDDTLATAIGCDTVYVEKYNVKITDNGFSWIFENDSCKTGDTRYYTNSKERCNNDYRNSKARCLLKVMNTSYVPSLCRPDKGNQSTAGLWCILDEEKPTTINK